MTTQDIVLGFLLTMLSVSVTVCLFAIIDLRSEVTVLRAQQVNMAQIDVLVIAETHRFNAVDLSIQRLSFEQTGFKMALNGLTSQEDKIADIAVDLDADNKRLIALETFRNSLSF